MVPPGKQQLAFTEQFDLLQLLILLRYRVLRLYLRMKLIVEAKMYLLGRMKPFRTTISFTLKTTQDRGISIRVLFYRCGN